MQDGLSKVFMTVAKVQPTTVRQIKQQAENTAKEFAVPTFWITDWLLFVIDKSALFLMTDKDYKLSDSQLTQFDAGIVKMQQGTPLAYLIGQQEFWSLNFKVNEHTLIPRPDTEVLVEHVLAWIADQSFGNQDNRLLDLGTGSGCIAISLAHELKQHDWQIVAVDVSINALNVAKHNAIQNAVHTIEFINSSWYGQLSDNDVDKFNVIVSNPPYIDKADAHLKGLTAEPISALTASNHGLADIEHIVTFAPHYLQAGGLLAIEHGFDQGSKVRQLFVDHGFEEVKTVKDYGGNDRITLGQLK